MARNKCHEMARRLDEFSKWIETEGKDSSEKYRNEVLAALNALKNQMEQPTKTLVSYNGAVESMDWNCSVSNNSIDSENSFTVGCATDESDQIVEENESVISSEEPTDSCKDSRTAEQILEDNGYEDVVIFKDESYDGALVGVSHDNRAVYSFRKMVEWLMEKDGIDETEAIEWIEYNTIRAIPYYQNAPIVLYDELI